MDDTLHEDCNNCNRYMDDCDGKSKDGDWIAPNKKVCPMDEIDYRESIAGER